MLSPSLNKITGLLGLFLLLTGLQLFAINDIVLKPGDKTSFSVIANTTQKLQVFNNISQFKTLWLSTEKGEFIEIIAPGYSKNNMVGAPQLPVLSKMIEIPTGAKAEVKIVSYELAEYRLNDFGITQRLVPVQAPQPKSGDRVPFSFNKSLYETNKFYAEKLARVEVAGYLRSVQLANLVISPVEYNPVSNTIRVYNNLVVEIQFTGGSKEESDLLKARTRSAYFNSIFSNVINHQPSDAPLDTISTVPVKFVIVADPMFQAALQPFVKWKIKRGFKVVEAYTNNPVVGNTFSSIKAYLKNLYNTATASDPAPTFALFVGDVAQVPAFNCGDHVSDLYYCEYTGDYLPELYYGRFSANNVAELMPQINKTLQYEQYQMPDPSFLNKVVMVAGADASHQMTWGNGQINYGTSNYFNAAHNLTSYTYLQPEPGGANYSQSIRNNISDGVSYANYTAHGSPDGWADPGFSIAQVASLQNENKYCLMVGNCCQTNTYNLTTFGEVLLRADKKGALGYIGASNLSYWDEDYWWGVGTGAITANPTYQTTGLGAYDRTFHDHGEPRSEWYSTMDQMVFAGNLAVQESNSGLKQYYWEIYCLMGDPSTMVYFSVPPAMSVNYIPFIPLGSPVFEVQTEPYAYIALSKNNVLHGVAEADLNGNAVINLLPFTEPGFVNIVITKQNKKPFIDSVLVASPEGPYLVLDEYLIKDNGGNNNQIPEFNELLTLDLTVENYGNADAINAVTTITSSDPYLTLPDNTHTWSIIPKNGSASATDALSIKTNNYVPDLHVASFVITTVADTKTFTSEISMQINAPKLQNSQITIDDTDHGNGNGCVDPGEIINMEVVTTNIGHCTTQPLNTMLIINGNYVTTNSTIINQGPLTPGASVSSTFTFSVSPNAPIGSTFSMFVIAEAGAYNSVATLIPTIGLQIEDFESGGFQKYSWNMAGNKPWTITSAQKSEGVYSARSGIINNSEKSELFIEGQVFTTDSISFYRRISSQTGHDFLRFYVDGNELGNWSGNKNWAKVSYLIPAGNHRFSWVYEKDVNTLAFEDAAWVDYIKFPPFSPSATGPLSVTAMAIPPTICEGGQSQLYAFATGGSGVYSYEWSPAASLNNATIFNPVATPTETTTYDVYITDLITVSNSAVVNVEQAPVTPVISQVANQLVSSSPTGNQWYNNQGLIPGATSQVYTPTSTNVYYVVASNLAGCPSEPSNSIFYGFTRVDEGDETKMLVNPNPFTDKLTISFYAETDSHTKIALYNSLGSEVAVIHDDDILCGNHQIIWNGCGLASGVYYCRIYSGNTIKIQKVIKK